MRCSSARLALVSLAIVAVDQAAAGTFRVVPYPPEWLWITYEVVGAAALLTIGATHVYWAWLAALSVPSVMALLEAGLHSPSALLDPGALPAALELFGLMLIEFGVIYVPLIFAGAAIGATVRGVAEAAQWWTLAGPPRSAPSYGR
jgi:hypothetical protein